jgi:hypothetical protein
MPAFDEAFANMFRAAGEAQQRGAEIASRKKREAWEAEDRVYQTSERQRIADARANMENTISGLDGGAQRDFAAAGYTPQQIATGLAMQGGPKQFAEQVARYQNDFDSSDLADAGAAARVAQGLPMQGGPISPAAVKAPRKSEIAAGQDPGAALADQDKAAGEERMKDWFGQFSHLSNEGLLKHPMLEGMLNGNQGVRGAVGLAKDGKTFIISDYNGSGTAESFTRAELMEAAYQKFLESEGRIPESAALGINRDQRRRTRNREDVRDTNDGTKLAYDMNMGNKRYGLAEEELRETLKYRNASLGLQRESMNRIHPVMSPEDRAALLKVESAWYEATDPKAKAELERQYQMVLSRASMNMGKPLGLPNGRAGRMAGDVKPADVVKFIEQLKNDPGNEGKTSTELYQIALATLSGGPAENPYAAAWGPNAPAAAPTKPQAATQPSAPLFRAPAPQGMPSNQNPNSWLYRGGADAVQPQPQGRGDSLYEMYQNRDQGLPAGVRTSGIGYIVNGKAYFSREDALRAAGY